MLAVYTVETAITLVPLMQLQVQMLENSRNKVITSKQTTKKFPSNIFKGFEVGTKVRLML